MKNLFFGSIILRICSAYGASDAVYNIRLYIDDTSSKNYSKNGLAVTYPQAGCLSLSESEYNLFLDVKMSVSSKSKKRYLFFLILC